MPTAGGVYGPLTGIVATTIAVFILFGSFMQGSGTGRLFSNLGAINSWSPVLSAIAPSVMFMAAAAGMIWWMERR